MCIRGIVAGQLTVGDAVLFLTLMNQLYAPLSFFGSYYRQVGSHEAGETALAWNFSRPWLGAVEQVGDPPGCTPPKTLVDHLSGCCCSPVCRLAQVQKGLIDMENMFDLLRTQPAVKDWPGAKPLVVRCAS